VRRAYFTVEGERALIAFCEKLEAMGYSINIVYPPMGQGYMVCWRKH
jgi:hypothetical protein